MAPPKKSKKTKRRHADSAKCSTKVSTSVDYKTVESDWWNCFWLKNSDSEPAVPSNETEGFKYFFRVSKKTFDYICSLVREDLISRPPSGLINIEGRLLTVEKQVAIALRRLASGESQVSVGSAFGVGQSTVSQVTWRFIESMEERAKHHLKWPEKSRIEEIKSNFKIKFGFPNCCGAIDATHIIMTLPAVETSEDWCDQASNYSMFLQAIVDDELRFLDIVTGWPGSMTVSRLLKCSGFYKLCEGGKRLEGEFIVAKAAYPLLPWLITPYNDDESNKFFNTKHEAIRVMAERALSMLKGAWRILHKVMWRPDKHKLPSVILVCCLLHNIIIDSGDALRDDVPLSIHHDLGYEEKSCDQVTSRGMVVRENILRHLQSHECHQLV
ncbi:hypothetical protein QJS10_CPA06g01924 [Acorus calamus]|uniref:DDE Tnp4 domain-containing protein n=1 Tax=Acorus calamus TaxID=4465 RepID=A0AAV9EQB3_ACOCL|nr:hypothetical protein QJS10_CPA06g01924 [Acorus calamus]